MWGLGFGVLKGGSKECRGLLLWLPVAFSILGPFEGPCVKYENDSCPCDAHLCL